LLRYSNLSFFQDCDRPPFWICGANFGTTHNGNLVVFITAKFGSNRISCFDNAKVCTFCALGLKMPIRVPFLAVFRVRIGENGNFLHYNPSRNAITQNFHIKISSTV